MAQLADTGYTGLRTMADAIIIRAAADYRSAVHRLKEQPGDPRVQEERKTIEDFFGSNWFWMLSTLQGMTPATVMRCTNIQSFSQKADRAIMRAWILLASKGLRHALADSDRFWFSCQDSEDRKTKKSGQRKSAGKYCFHIQRPSRACEPAEA